MNISKAQESLLIACILGDGYLTKHRPGRANPKLEIQHSEKQLDYLLWKKDLLIKNGFKVSKIYDVSRTHKAYRFSVNLDKETGIELRHRFYPNNNKTISRHELNKLTPLGVAIWFMDDGCRRVSWDKKNDKCTGRSLHLATHNFSYEENVIIQKYFKTVYKVDANIRRDGEHFYLSINATNAKIFISIIEPFMIDTMLYKIDLKYKIK